MTSQVPEQQELIEWAKESSSLVQMSELENCEAVRNYRDFLMFSYTLFPFSFQRNSPLLKLRPISLTA